ncbi:TetR family transcriptional regulator [Kribbella steppae]|uniref:TetR family transcriptional regulator n=1 Tax=Kribbella steppae TaxID=2512223 RepID=A0A4R2HHK7_9ACTN|nr:TetR/AcrR family transcriptional regulator [Kribbella steppae]TCO28316.1 TetR family transcriptional regulator [Kribbella steppae]
MPKIVDPSERRQHLAEAAWRVILRDGLEHASVRNVAREAGLSNGSLRHIFSTQAELLVFAMNQVVERIERRLGSLDPAGDPRTTAERFLVELLPLDEERQEENAVWLAFTARALVDPELRECAERSYDALRAGCRRWVTEIAGDQVDVEWEADRLHAVLDGLAVHAATRPDIATADRLQAILAMHLDSLVPQKKRRQRAD